MAAIRGVDTKPEMIIRRGLHARGFRFRLHDRKLPGRPDLTLPKYQAVIFINGCFWHGHDCHLFKWPKTREEFWRAKIEGNVTRDADNRKVLQNAKWRVGLIWECALKGRRRLPPGEGLARLAVWLKSERAFLEVRGDTRTEGF